MKKNTELVEFYICPHCKRANWELIDFIPLKSTSEYACLAECDFCGIEIMVIDFLKRCEKCEHKVECISTPLKHTTISAMAKLPLDPGERIAILNRIEKQIS